MKSKKSEKIKSVDEKLTSLENNKSEIMKCLSFGKKTLLRMFL